MTSAYPLPPEVLVERVRALANELGEWPSQRHVMRECRVGAPRADAALAALRDEGFDPARPRGLTVVRAQPESTEEHDGSPGDATPEGDSAGAQTAGEALVTDTAAPVSPGARR